MDRGGLKITKQEKVRSSRGKKQAAIRRRLAVVSRFFCFCEHHPFLELFDCARSKDDVM